MKLISPIHAIKAVRDFSRPNVSFSQDKFDISFSSIRPGLKETKDLIEDIMELGARRYCEALGIKFKGLKRISE